ncbi:hypothetical protein GCM10010254_70070 [Streptomyces chromofuscus]|nr:hypothetical protein GCM10010254_70070 [Streptomyces chromofuscus]
MTGPKRCWTDCSSRAASRQPVRLVPGRRRDQRLPPPSPLTHRRTGFRMVTIVREGGDLPVPGSVRDRGVEVRTAPEPT